MHQKKPRGLLMKTSMIVCAAISLGAGCASGATTNAHETTKTTSGFTTTTTGPVTTPTSTTPPTTTITTTTITTTTEAPTTMLEAPPGVWVPNTTSKNGEPTVWACGTIRIAVNGPAVLQQLVQDAVNELNNINQQATHPEETGVNGVSFQTVPLGSQKEVTVNWTWSSTKPEKGKTWSSGWTDIKNNGTTYTGGIVDINPAMVDSPALQQETIRHELGHVLGLGHNNDPESIMNSQTITTIDYSKNDLAGIAWLNNHCKQPNS